MARGVRKSTYKNRNTNKHRKGFKAVIFPWLRRFGMGAAIVIVLGWLSAWFFLSNADTRVSDWAQNKAIEITAAMGFTINDIYVEGRQYADADILKAIINVQKGDPLFSFNPKDAQYLIEQIGWVKAAHVERRWPGTIYIAIREKTPIALWQKDKRLRLLDEDGEIITTKTLTPFKEMIIVIGQDVPQTAPDLIANLKAEAAVFNRVESATRVSNRRWDLTLKNNIKIKLPEDDVGLALRQLARAQEDNNMLEKDLMSLDVRDPSRMIVRTRPGALEEYRAREHKAGFQPAANHTGNNI